MPCSEQKKQIITSDKKSNHCFEALGYCRVVYKCYSVSEISLYLLFNLHFQSNDLTHLQKYSSRQTKLLNLITYLHEQKGMGYRKIASYLNESGIKTQRGKTFSNSSVHSVLKRYEQRVARIKEVREVKFTKKITNFRISSIHESDDLEST